MRQALRNEFVRPIDKRRRIYAARAYQCVEFVELGTGNIDKWNKERLDFRRDEFEYAATKAPPKKLCGEQRQ